MSLTPFLELWPVLCKVVRWVTKRKPHTITALIVEDDLNDAELLSLVLKKRGMETEIATSGDVAAGLVRHTFYPVVFLDMRLSGMSGEALLRVLSRDSPNASVVVVCGEPSDLAKIPASRFVSVIRKPATGDAIDEMLAKMKLIL